MNKKNVIKALIGIGIAGVVALGWQVSPEVLEWIYAAAEALIEIKSEMPAE